MYTSSSGIWQPAWLEPVDAAGISDLHLVPDVDRSFLRLTANTYSTAGVSVMATVLDGGTPVASAMGAAGTELDIPISNPKLWSPDSPFLYGLQLRVTHNGLTNDAVSSYFGMRKISVAMVGGVPRIYLNNQFLFEMGPLDQGFWPDGIYTAPTDEALKYDLQQEKALGFNMVRKHIKVERERWYYWADTLGLLVWQDMPSCNSYTGNPSPPPVNATQFLTELSRMVQTHWNSPAIIMWDLFNESQGQENTTGGVGQTNTAYLVQMVKTLDPSRLVNQASGGSYYGVGDVFDNHSYPAPGNPTSSTQAAVDGEFGGIGFQLSGHLWNPALAGGNYIGANTTDDIATIYDSFVQDLMNYKSNDGLNAAVYTQITDVENECNGLMTYDRVLKPDLLKIEISNEKAESGQLFVTPILPTSQVQGQTWRYTTNANTASLNWYANAFDDSTWSSGQAGFGTVNTPGAIVRTTWNTSDIWLRREFTLGALTSSVLNNLAFNCYHDEDCEIYLNGVLAGSASGYTTSYVLFPINAAGRSALIPNGNNVIAVHCHQTVGGQNIDVGISESVLVADTLTVPADPLGYWPLDETSGTTAKDASGNGDDGTVNGAAWSANGHIGGCLNFNGLSSYVQVNRNVSGDFSIAFWVKTTQTGGAGQWSQGIGLVDGTTAGVANDFGTALSGSKFAFGVGDPDTTLLSTNSINDGAWHQCVATRQQASGIMRIYVDGRLEASGTGNTNALGAASFLRFGCLQTGQGFLNGSLDEVRIFNRVLGHLEVAALYDSSASAVAGPTNLTATAADGQVSLAWDDSVGATSYNVRRSTASGGPYALIGNTTATTFTDTNAVNGLSYYYVVTVVNSFGEGAPSAEVSAKPFVLAAWFTTDSLSGLANGSPVFLWPDSSGNGDNATQSSPSQQPMYVTGALNGMPVVRFNGTNNTYLAFNRPVQDDFTIMFVYRSSQGIGTGTAFYQGAGLVNGEVGGVVNDFGTSLNANGQILAGTGNPDTTIASSGGLNDGRPHIVSFERSRGSGSISLYVDGVLAGNATGGTQSLTSPARLVLGAQQTLLSFLTGDIAEVKIFDVALPAAERSGEENALKCRYGLSSGSAPGAPTGLQASPGSTQVALSWTPSPGAETYSVSWSTNAGGPFQTIADGQVLSAYADTNALSGATNYFEVTAANACGSSSPSAPLAVFLPQPSLGVTLGASALVVNWPEWASGWELVSATNLLPPVAWMPVTSSITTNNGQVSATLPFGFGNRFFKLLSH